MIIGWTWQKDLADKLASIDPDDFKGVPAETSVVSCCTSSTARRLYEILGHTNAEKVYSYKAGLLLLVGISVDAHGHGSLAWRVRNYITWNEFYINGKYQEITAADGSTPYPYHSFDIGGE